MPEKSNSLWIVCGEAKSVNSYTNSDSLVVIYSQLGALGGVCRVIFAKGTYIENDTESH